MYSPRTKFRADLLTTAVAISLTAPVLAQDKSVTPGTSTPSSTAPKPAPQEKSGSLKSSTAMPVLIVVPTIVTAETATKSGCWAKLYNEKNFTGDSFTLVGPIDMANMRGPFGISWENKVRSMETGPKASVTIFDNEGFRDKDAKIAANKKVPEMDNKLGLFDNFRSMKISC